MSAIPSGPAVSGWHRLGVGVSRLSAVRRRHPVAFMLLQRSALGVATLLLASMIVFVATEVLPGNAAYAILGHSATAQRLHALEVRLHLTGSVVSQYLHWLGNLLSGNPGRSLVNGQTVLSLVGPRIVDSAVLVLLAGLIGTIIGVAAGGYAGFRRDKLFDQIVSPVALAVTSLPEFVIGIVLVAVFATLVLHWLPGVSVYAPGQYAWSEPRELVLPVITLVFVTVPYLYRMMRGVTIEALESDYVEMARLKGVPERRIALRHVLPNTLPATIQVIGLNLLYLAGGIVVVEQVFNFPGLGQGLVSAVDSRDLPTVQFIVIVLAAFYVVVNILADVGSLLASPRRRFPRR
jgi:peptide/nickel transport system permease protein